MIRVGYDEDGYSPRQRFIRWLMWLLCLLSYQINKFRTWLSSRV